MVFETASREVKETDSQWMSPYLLRALDQNVRGANYIHQVAYILGMVLFYVAARVNHANLVAIVETRRYWSNRESLHRENAIAKTTDIRACFNPHLVASKHDGVPRRAPHGSSFRTLPV